MKSFFSNIVSSFVGASLALCTLFLLFIFIVAAFFAGVIQTFESDASTAKVMEKSVLVLQLNYAISETTSEDPFDHYDFDTMESRVTLGLDDILKSISSATTDSNIEGIYLNIAPVAQGWASSEALRKALLSFKLSGKWVIAYNEIYSHQSYYISSVAEKVFINPEGLFEFQGLSAQSLFLKNTLEKLDIEMQVVKGPDNEYKSAVEMFTQDSMSESDRFQMQTLVDELWQHVLMAISQSRNIEVSKLNEIADSLAIILAKDALSFSLVDDLLYQDQVRNLVKEKLGIELTADINGIAIEDYSVHLQTQKLMNTLADADQKQQIAVVYADGEITSGVNDDGVIGSLSTGLVIRKALKNDKVKAMVLRINSPGGSALASDVILREALLFAEQKPLIVSFGNVAASGGYYIALAGNKIFAQENTLTGSIGVFGLLPNVGGFLENKIGVQFDQVSTNTYADFGSGIRSLKTLEKQRLDQHVSQTYQVFKSHIAKQRNMTQEQVEEIAKGRVWSGTAAKERGLVDELGGLADAISEAALQAELTDYEILKLPRQETPFKRFFKQSDNAAKTWLAKSILGDSIVEMSSPWLQHFQTMSDINLEEGAQVRLPFSYTIQ